MDVATRAFDTLAAKHGDVLEDAFSKVEGFGKKPLGPARQALRLAALLHDVGHASFSHAAEKVVHKGSGHEKLSIKIIQEHDLMGKLIQGTYGDVVIRTVPQIIEGSNDMPPQLSVLHDLISGQMDADRTDYLLRDSHHCGVDYGKFDYRRMIECLELSTGEFGEIEVALNRDGLHTFEALILARYQMNAQVYYHRVRRIYDKYLELYHEELAKENEFTDEKILAHNDVTMMSKIFADAVDPNCGEKHKWAKRIADRRHHKQVHETGVNARALELQRSGNVLKGLEAKYPKVDFIYDKASANIHKLLTPDDEDESGKERLSIIGNNGHKKEIGFESQILSKIPRSFQSVRIFVDNDGMSDNNLLRIKTLAAEIWNSPGDRV
jgi:HD superfamily phosphohydrolase